jgi:NAD(P)-dependent dehydrogenase (short-subunit alcohol dehydrogenase family)
MTGGPIQRTIAEWRFLTSMSNLFDLSGRVAVVVGATSGLGRAIAIGLAQHGADVVPSGRRKELVESACEQIKAMDRRTLVHPANVHDRQSIDKLRDTVLKHLGRVDILVNAAGNVIRQPTISASEEEWSSVLDTHLNGALRACQSFYEPLKASGHGRIINIASLSSFAAFHQVAAYSAAKTAILSLTRSLACEWAKDGIRVNAIAPGVFPTDLNRDVIMGTARGREMLMRTPMGRFGQPEELIGTAVLLASDGASFLTGQCIAVDGGYLALGVNS